LRKARGGAPADPLWESIAQPADSPTGLLRVREGGHRRCGGCRAGVLDGPGSREGPVPPRGGRGAAGPALPARTACPAGSHRPHPVLEGAPAVLLRLLLVRLPCCCFCLCACDGLLVFARLPCWHCLYAFRVAAVACALDILLVFVRVPCCCCLCNCRVITTLQRSNSSNMCVL
jgi:hypothetical protein